MITISIVSRERFRKIYIIDGNFVITFVMTKTQGLNNGLIALTTRVHFKKKSSFNEKKDKHLITFKYEWLNACWKWFNSIYYVNAAMWDIFPLTWFDKFLLAYIIYGKTWIIKQCFNDILIYWIAL